MKLAGSSPELGEWDLDRAPELSWSDGNVWRGDVELPAGSDVHFKVQIFWLCVLLCCTFLTAVFIP